MGKVCPHCKSDKVSRNGKYNNKQRYISNYMYWFKWLELFENDKEAVKAKNLMVQSNVAHAYTKIIDFKERKPIFV